MFLVYWIAMVAVGAPATDWANDGLFGDGWHLLGIGSKAYNEVNDEYTASLQAVEAFLASRSIPRPMTLIPLRHRSDERLHRQQQRHRYRGCGG